MNVQTSPTAVPSRRPSGGLPPLARHRGDAAEWEELDESDLPGWDGVLEGLLVVSSRRLHAAAAADLLSR